MRLVSWWHAQACKENDSDLCIFPFLCQCFVKQGHEEQLIAQLLTVSNIFYCLSLLCFQFSKGKQRGVVIRIDSKDIAAAPASGARSRNFWQYFIHLLLKNYQLGFLKFKCKLWSVHQINAWKRQGNRRLFVGKILTQ